MTDTFVDYKFMLHIPGADFRALNAIGDKTGLTLEQVISVIVRIAASTKEVAIEDVTEFLKKESAPDATLFGYENNVTEKSNVIPLNKIRTDETYHIDQLKPVIKDFLRKYIRLASLHKKLMTPDISPSEHVLGYVVKRVGSVIRRKTWNTEEIIEALSRMPWYNGDDEDATWKGATIKWLTGKTQGEDLYGYERMIEKFREGKSVMPAPSGGPQTVLSDADKSKLRDVMRKVCRDGGLNPSMDSYRPTGQKLFRVAVSNGIQFCVSKVATAENSFEFLQETYNKLVLDGKIPSIS